MLKHTKGENTFNVFNIMFMLLLVVVTVYPYLNQLAISLNEGMDAMMGGITVLPRKFTLENYKVVFSNPSFGDAAMITVSRVLIATVLSILVVFGAAYGLTRKNLPFKKLMTLYLMIPNYISAGVIPLYMLYRDLHLINNYLVYVIPGIFSFYNMVIVRSFVQELPPSIQESAEVDGANEIVIMFKIILPLSTPVLATIALWVAVGMWNDWTTTLLYVTEKKLFPLQYLMMRLIKESELAREMATQSAMNNTAITAQPTPDTVKAATLIVTTLPIIMVYPFLQKYFIKGVVLGAVKE